MTSELRPARELAALATRIWHRELSIVPAEDAFTALIQEDREAVRAEQAAELAKFKALAETLVSKIELFRSMLIDNDFDFGEAVEEFLSAVEPALRKYKEARDETPSL